LSHTRQAYFPFVNTEVTGAGDEFIMLCGTAVEELFTVGFASFSFENALNGDGAVADLVANGLVGTANGLVGDADDIGGKPALIVFFTMGFASSSFFENALNDRGVTDTGGKEASLVAFLVVSFEAKDRDDMGGQPVVSLVRTSIVSMFAPFQTGALLSSSGALGSNTKVEVV
jgi:hypothetical protein